MNRVLIDVNIILDVVLNRAEHVASSASVFRHLREKKIGIFVASITVTTLYYVARKIKGRDFAEQAVGLTLDQFEIIPVGRQTLQTAWELHRNDFEDAVQASAAKEYGLDIVVTRDRKGFRDSGLRVYSPQEFLEYLETMKT